MAWLLLPSGPPLASIPATHLFEVVHVLQSQGLASPVPLGLADLSRFRVGTQLEEEHQNTDVDGGIEIEVVAEVTDTLH